MNFKYTPLTTSYSSFLFELLKNVESVKRFAYYDSAKERYPTIGVGFNLTDGSVFDDMLLAIGFELDDITKDERNSLYQREA